MWPSPASHIPEHRPIQKGEWTGTTAYTSLASKLAASIHPSPA